MYCDPSGHSVFLTMLLIAIGVGGAIGGTLNGIKAYNEGARDWGLFGAIAGGAILGGAMGAVMVLGGAAGLASILPAGAGIAGFGLSTLGALILSAGIGVGAGMVSYSLENGLRNDKEWTWGGFVKAGLSGGAKALGTFGIGFMGGRMGAFDKMILYDLLGKEFAKDALVYGMTKSVLASVLPSAGRTAMTWLSLCLGETLTKILIINSLAALARKLIDLIF